MEGAILLLPIRPDQAARRRPPALYARDLERIGSALARGDRVELRGFGAFSTRGRGGRIGRNPRTRRRGGRAGQGGAALKAGKGLLKRLNLGDAPAAEPGSHGASGVEQCFAPILPGNKLDTEHGRF